MVEYVGYGVIADVAHNLNTLAEHLKREEQLRLFLLLLGSADLDVDDSLVNVRFHLVGIRC